MPAAGLVTEAHGLVSVPWSAVLCPHGCCRTQPAVSLELDCMQYVTPVCLRVKSFYARALRQGLMCFGAAGGVVL